MANYDPKNKEINQLYLSFSNLTKTIKIARTSMFQGDENQALLNYHECAQIYDQLHNIEKKGRCYNNLGVIYLKKGQFNKSKFFLEESIVM